MAVQLQLFAPAVSAIPGKKGGKERRSGKGGVRRGEGGGAERDEEKEEEQKGRSEEEEEEVEVVEGKEKRHSNEDYASNLGAT